MPDYPQQPQQPQQPPRQMQGYYNPNYYPKPAETPPHGANMKIALTMITIGIIIIGLVLVFVFAPRGQGVASVAAAETTYQAPKFETGDIVFASNVDNDMKYTEVTDNTYKIADTVWIYLRIKDVQAGQLKGSWKTSYDEYITVIGPDGKVVDSLTGFLGRTTENAESGKYYSFSVAHALQTDSTFKPGRYEVTIYVNDILNNIEQKSENAFILK